MLSTGIRNYADVFHEQAHSRPCKGGVAAHTQRVRLAFRNTALRATTPPLQGSAVQLVNRHRQECIPLLFKEGWPDTFYRLAGGVINLKEAAALR